MKGLSEVRVPETIQEIMMARLDRLGDDGKRTVQLASVIGRQFLVRLLARVAGLSERLDGRLLPIGVLDIPDVLCSTNHPALRPICCMYCRAQGCRPS